MDTKEKGREAPTSAVPTPEDARSSSELLHNATPAPAKEEGDFDWRNDPTIVVPDQPPVAVFTNCFGDVVIRQAAFDAYDEDSWIRLRPENVRAVAEAITRLARELS